MADLSIVAANVVAGDNAVVEFGKSGATVAAGKVVYVDPTSKKAGLADSNGTAVAKVPRGIALNGGSDNQPLAWARSGDVNFGAAIFTAGTAYYLSDTPGGICPVADVGSGENVVLLGVAKSASVLALDIQISGVTL